MKKFNIKTGVIGVGSMGQNHARILSEVSNLVGICDPDPVQGKEVADKFGIPWFKKTEDLLGITEAVCIAVPTSYHLEVARSAIHYSNHVLVEKPLSNSSESAHEIVKLANDKGVVLTVGHVERHNPVVAIAKEHIEQNLWGEVISFSSRRVSNFPERIHDVGVLFDLAIHDIDICSYLSNSPIESVFASGGSKKAKHEDYINLILKHENGIVSTCETNWLTPMKVRMLSITTSTHFIELNFQDQTVRTYKSEFQKVDKSNLFEVPVSVESQNLAVKKEEPLKLEICDFLSSILNSRYPLVSGEDGMDVVEISEAALKSLNSKANIFIRSEK